MQAAASQPGFAVAVARLRVDEDTLSRLARLTARLYAGSGDFTALHLVTSAHALRLLLRGARAVAGGEAAAPGRSARSRGVPLSSAHLSLHN